MPDEIYEGLVRALDFRIVKTTAAAVNALPLELRSLIKITPIPVEPAKSPYKSEGHSLVFSEYPVA
jgi:hypothetical protein